jgi:hypothetical protein
MADEDDEDYNPLQDLLDQRKRAAEEQDAKLSDLDIQATLRAARIRLAVEPAVAAIKSAIEKSNATLARNNLTEYFALKEVTSRDFELYRAEFLLKAKNEKFAVAGGHISITRNDGMVGLKYTYYRNQEGDASADILGFDEDTFSVMLAEVYKLATT